MEHNITRLDHLHSEWEHITRLDHLHSEWEHVTRLVHLHSEEHITRLDHLHSELFLVSSTDPGNYRRDEFEKCSNLDTIFSKNSKVLKTKNKELFKTWFKAMRSGEIEIYSTNRFCGVCLPSDGELPEPLKGHGIVIFNTDADTGKEERSTIHCSDARDVLTLCTYINREKNMSNMAKDMNYHEPLSFVKEGIIYKHKKRGIFEFPKLQLKPFWGEIRRMGNGKLQLSLNKSGITEMKRNRLYKLNYYHVHYGEVTKSHGIMKVFKLKYKSLNIFKPIEETTFSCFAGFESVYWLMSLTQPGGARLNERPAEGGSICLTLPGGGKLKERPGGGWMFCCDEIDYQQSLPQSIVLDIIAAIWKSL